MKDNVTASNVIGLIIFKVIIPIILIGALIWGFHKASEGIWELAGFGAMIFIFIPILFKVCWD